MTFQTLVLAALVFAPCAATAVQTALEVQTVTCEQGGTVGGVTSAIAGKDDNATTSAATATATTGTPLGSTIAAPNNAAQGPLIRAALSTSTANFFLVGGLLCKSSTSFLLPTILLLMTPTAKAAGSESSNNTSTNPLTFFVEVPVVSVGLYIAFVAIAVAIRLVRNGDRGILREQNNFLLLLLRGVQAPQRDAGAHMV